MEKDGLKGRELRYFCLFSAAVLFVAAFCFDSPRNIFQGMITIITSRDALITDYMELAGFGAGFFNAGLMLCIAVLMVDVAKLPFTGLTLAAVFLNVGFAFWGKNPVNILPILFGTWVYTRMHRQKYSKFVYTALFGACLAPFVSEMFYILPFPPYVNMIFALALGILIGTIIPPMASHTASIHMGYSLFNVGFAGGVIAFIFFSILKALNIGGEPVFIWSYGRHPGIVIGVYVYFVITIFYGMWLTDGEPKAILRLMKHPGRAVADFVLMEGAGATLINMGLLGIIAESYVIIVGGDMAGPVLGGILTVFGFGAFGAHLKNYIPVLLGVYISSYFITQTYGSYAMVIAALFCVGLAPIAGQYGVIAGIVAGIIHSMLVMSTGALYGGLNLYNNGFSCGWVALLLVSIIESHRQHVKLMKLMREEKEKEPGTDKEGSVERDL